MLSPFVFAECDRESISIERAEAARGRLIPAAMIAPPKRTRLRDISVISFVFSPETSVLMIDLIGYVTSPF